MTNNMSFDGKKTFTSNYNLFRQKEIPFDKGTQNRHMIKG